MSWPCPPHTAPLPRLPASPLPASPPPPACPSGRRVGRAAGGPRAALPARLPGHQAHVDAGPRGLSARPVGDHRCGGAVAVVVVVVAAVVVVVVAAVRDGMWVGGLFEMSGAGTSGRAGSSAALGNTAVMCLTQAAHTSGLVHAPASAGLHGLPANTHTHTHTHTRTHTRAHTTTTQGRRYASGVCVTARRARRAAAGRADAAFSCGHCLTT